MVLNLTSRFRSRQQELLIGDNLPGINLQQSSEIAVQIEQASDKNTQPVFPVPGNDLHVRTIFATPVADFLSSDDVVNEASFGTYTVGLSKGEPQNAIYQWSVNPPEGTSANLKSIENDKAKILWNGPIWIL